MRHLNRLTLFLTVCAATGFSFEPSRASISKMHDTQLTSLEKEVVSLAEAMPADKYQFAPTQGAFEGVRTFGQLMTHIATVIYEVSSGVLGEKMPVEAGKAENGPASLKSKEEIVKYLKDSLTYAHKAMASLTADNFTEIVKSPFGGEDSRGYLADVSIWHSYDHYGQAVEYLRMNGIVPPASRR